VLEAAFILLESPSPSRRIFIGSHSIPPSLVRRIGPSTQPCSQLVFESASDDELSEEIFQEEEHELGDDEDGGVVPPVEHVHTTSTTVVDDPSPTPTTTNQDQGEAVVEGEVASRREPPR
jgi:hypothetical protein